MDKYKKKLIKNYVLQFLSILSFLMIIIPIIIAAFKTNILVGICILGFFIGIPTLIYILTDDD